MQDVFLVGDEPLPGYKLVENTGGTAFYRTWKVLTPDGSFRVWKEIDLVVGNAAIETRTLGLLVQLRHPKLNTLTNFWNLGRGGNSLIIESELPRSSLRQRLNECQKLGMPGIPVDELLRYMTDAAEGLDFLNAPTHNYQGKQVAVYHRALRPECLLLFADGPRQVCKVSDFGLAKPVTDQVAQHSQGLMHYEYDPPEFFEGQTTATSDQYSLAINYYELRTGQLPFQGTMLEQLQARLSDSPQLGAVSDAERAVVRRALSREPTKRYESCRQFVKALIAATGDASSKMADAARTPVRPEVGTINPRLSHASSRRDGASREVNGGEQPAYDRAAALTPAGRVLDASQLAARGEDATEAPGKPPAGMDRDPSGRDPRRSDFDPRRPEADPRRSDPDPRRSGLMPPHLSSPRPLVAPGSKPESRPEPKPETKPDAIPGVVYRRPPDADRDAGGREELPRAGATPEPIRPGAPRGEAPNVRNIRQQLKGSGKSVPTVDEPEQKEVRIPLSWVLMIMIVTSVVVWYVLTQVVPGTAGG